MSYECKTHHDACDCQEAEHLFQIERRDEEINRLRTLARDAYEAWDNDRDARVGKLLTAMLYKEFSEKYRPDLTPNLSGEPLPTTDKG